MNASMHNKRIIDEIHEGFCPDSEEQSDGSAPDKIEFARDFARAFSPMDFLKEWTRLDESETRKMQTISQEVSSIRSLISELRILLGNPLLQFTHECIENEENTEKSERAKDKYDLLKKNLWERLQLVKPQWAQWVKDTNKECDEKTLHVRVMDVAFQGGIYNAAYTVGAALCVIPEIYRQQTGDVITPERWKEVGASVLPFARDLLSSQMEVFDYGIMQSLTRKTLRPPAPSSNGQSFDVPGFDATALLINDEHELCLNPSIIEPTRARLIKLIEGGDIRITGERVGCPARGIFGPVHARYMHAAETGLFPFAKHILSLPHE